jgi:tetratricopeptide (TPR) repeat protein
LYAKGEYQKALDALETIPEEPEVLKAKANNLAMLGRVREAIKCYRTIVKRHSRDPATLVDFATFLVSLSEYDRAVKMYDQAIRLEPNVAVVHRDRALALRFGGHHEAALEGYDTALKLDAGNGDTWAAKADLLIELHRFPEAIGCLEKASAAPSRSLDAIGWTSRGARLAQEEGYEEALHCYDRALEQDPEEASALTGKASVLRRKGDLDGALACYDRLIEVRPDDALGWTTKGSVLVDARRFEEALNCYKKALEREPNDQYSWANSGYCRLELKQYSEALSDYERAVDLNPGLAYAWEGKGRCFYELGRLDEAVSAWRQALKLVPDLMWSNNNIGLVLTVREKYEEALEWFDRAIKLGPDETVPVVNKARTLIAMKRMSEAHALLEGVLEKARDDSKSEILELLANLFSEHFKDARKALELFEQAAAMGATRPEMALNIAEMLIRLDRQEEGRGRASSVLLGDAGPELRTVAAFLVYASHALEGDLGTADRCFANFADRMGELARGSDRGQAAVKWTYDGLLDTVVKSQVSLATKFALVAAIDLQTGQLGAPGLSNLRQFLPLIQQPAPRPPVVTPGESA